MSLTSCLKAAGKALDATDKAAIIDRARALRGEGKSAAEAAAAAVDERLGFARELMAQEEAVYAETVSKDDAKPAEKSAGTSPRILNQSTRGTFNPATNTIALLKDADLTTFLHESGHFYLEVLADLASKPDAPQAIRDDMDQLLTWFGITDGKPINAVDAAQQPGIGGQTRPPEAAVSTAPDAGVEPPVAGRTALETWNLMTLDEKRPFHEKFARGFEAYLFEGKAPSPEVQGLFQRFRAWMVNVYKHIEKLSVSLTPEVRGVMDRLIATDEQIQAAEAARGMGLMFKDEAEAAKFGVDWAAYQAQGAQATATAIDELQTKGVKDMQWLSNARSKRLKQMQKQADALRTEIELAVRADVMSQPVYRAWQYLTSKDDTGENAGKLDTEALKEQYGEKPEAVWRKLSALHMTSPTVGISPDIVAEMFGFTSGDEMVQAIAAATPPREVVSALTDQRMLQQHGELATPEGVERATDAAIHNQLRARVVATELAALEKAANPSEVDESQSLYRRRVRQTMPTVAKKLAADIIARTRVRDLRPDLYSAAEARAAKATLKALGKGDLVEAVAQKRAQLINGFANTAAHDAKGEVQTIIDFMRKVNAGNMESVAKTRDTAIVQAMRAVIADYGIGTKGKAASEYLSALEAYDPETYRVLRDKVDAMTAGAAEIKDMTVEALRGLNDELRGMWFLAKRGRQMEIDGALVDREQLQYELEARLIEIGVPDRVPGEGMAVTDSERRLTMLQSALAALVRVESWVGVKDGKGGGPFRRIIWQPIREAADRYRADRGRYLKQYRGLLDGLSLGRARIDAPELGYTFGHSRGGSGKQEILHAILHTGNESNKRKLLLGRGWATQNDEGGLDTSRWDSFLSRMIENGTIGKAEFDFAQGVWDMLEDTKPLAQKTHRDVFGRYFAEITSDSFVTPFGTYRGGYVPAMTDSEVVKDAKTRELMEQENQTLAFAFPSTNKGFTKGRVEYNKPLLLDLRSLSQHIDKVLLFSHMEQPIRDVRKVLTSKTVAEPLNRVDPTAFDGLLTPWMNRAARQSVEAPIPGSNGLMRFFSKARSHAGMAAMFANVSNTAQQITGLSIAALKVKPRYLLAAAAQGIHSPRATAKAVSNASSYMATRMDNEVHQMTGAINDILLNPSVYEKAQSWAAKHAYFMQAAVDNVLGPIVWNGAYNQALEAGANERDAIRAADSAVRQTQGSTLPEDVSRIETGNAFVRMFTQFAGYFNMQANVLGEEFSKNQHNLGLRKGMGRGLYIFTFGFLAPALVSELIVQAFRGGPGDDDDDGYLDDWLAALGIGTIRSSLAMVPVVGPAVNAGINTWNKKPYDDRISTSPAISMIESAVSAPHSVYQAVFNEGSAKKAVRDVATLITMTTGLPATAVARPVGYLADVAQNRSEPTGPIDAARGLVTGAVSKESKK